MDCGVAVVDISSISLCKREELQDQDFLCVVEPLSEALRQTGFVYIRGHGIQNSLVKQAMAASLEYFHLPDTIKAQHIMGVEYQGWVGQGREIFDQDKLGQISKLEARETYNIRDLSLDGKFPDQHCPSLRPALTALARASHQLTLRLLSCLSLALGQPKNFLSSIHQGILSQGSAMSPVPNCSNLRSLYYPALSPDLANTSTVTRCGQHSDYGTITLLFQDSQPD